MSSSSSVCQGLQPCVEPRVLEPRVLRLKLAPPPNHESQPFTTTNHNHDELKKDMGGGWNFLQTLSHTCPSHQQQQVYVHPTAKRSSSMLSEKSLEMCTESLGCETGSNAGDSSSDENSLFESGAHFADRSGNVVVPPRTRRVNRVCSFPPPLTSITDFDGIRVRPRRQDGRLILEAFPNSHFLHHTFLHAERSDGRLRISLFESDFGSECDDEEVEEGVDEEWEQEYDDDDDDEEVEEEQECVVDKYEMPIRRCKESGKRDIFGDAYFEQFPSLSLCL